MGRRRTLPQNIRHYKQQYLCLLAYEARLNHQLFKMKKRIKLLAEEEQLRLTEKALLSEQLQQVYQQRTELESQPASKQRDTQLKRAEKEFKKVKVRHSRNQYQLDQLEVRKDKDNVANLILKEVRRDDITLRIQSAYETWIRLEQIQQQQAIEQAIQAEIGKPTNAVKTQDHISQVIIRKRRQTGITCIPGWLPVQKTIQKASLVKQTCYT